MLLSSLHWGDNSTLEYNLLCIRLTLLVLLALLVRSQGSPIFLQHCRVCIHYTVYSAQFHSYTYTQSHVSHVYTVTCVTCIHSYTYTQSEECFCSTANISLQSRLCAQFHSASGINPFFLMFLSKLQNVFVQNSCTVQVV